MRGVFETIKSLGWKRLRLSLASGGVCLALVGTLLATQPPFFRRLDRMVYDIFLREFANGEPSKTPILIDIDERSIGDLGQWPWPRYRLAELLAALYQGGVDAIGVDILMTEPDRTSPALWAKQITEDFGVEPDFTGIPPELMDNDRYLASIMKQIPVVISAQITENPNDIASSSPKFLPIADMRDPGAPRLEQILRNNAGIQMPVPVLADAASYLGLMNAEGDEDSIFRRIPLFQLWNGKPVAGLALATLALYAGNHSLAVNIASDGQMSIKTAGVVIPVSHGGSMPIAFRGKSGSYPV
ncbi:MAG: CHASE2 domain-containing protein, partial [Synergistaceae bacterium]|nr:CHASE2 domain-containing protein [Synergistaceae bacterium]